MVKDLQLKSQYYHDVATILGGMLSYEWMNIGVLIGVPMEKLKAIHSKDHLSDADTCLYKMLLYYFNSAFLGTWGILIAASKWFNMDAARRLIALCQNLNPTMKFNHEVLLQQVTLTPEDRGSWTGLIDIHEVFRYLIPHSAKWFQIGKNLRLPPEAIEVISHNWKDCCDRLREVLFVTFTQMSPECTWFTFANAMKGIHAVTAARLRAKGIIGQLYCTI